MKLYFKRRPPGSAYFTESVEEVPEALAKKYIADGYAEKAEEIKKSPKKRLKK